MGLNEDFEKFSNGRGETKYVIRNLRRYIQYTEKINKSRKLLVEHEIKKQFLQNKTNS